MRTEEEIEAKIKEIGAELDDCKYSQRELIDAILDVLENDLESDEIEGKYFDENKTDREQCANRARDWMDGETDELYF